MVTSKPFAVALLMLSGAAGSREAASPADCQAAASRPAIVGAQAALDRSPADLKATFALADAWSDTGCFNESLKVLQDAQAAHPASKELETRLRVAGSLVGEEHFFDNLERANIDAKLKRVAFRCGTLGDVDACSEATRLNPDDPALQMAQGDALAKARRPADALAHYRRAGVLAPNLPGVAEKIGAVETQLAAIPGSALGAANHDAVPASTSRDRLAQRRSGSGAGGSGNAAGLVKAPAERVGESPKVRVAQAASRDGTPRRYTNAAQADRSH